MCLACKHVNDVVIGAPYIITEDLIKSLNISKVVNIINTNEDKPKKEYEHLDQYEVPKKMGIYVELSIDDPFYDITVESIAQRVLKNKEEFKKKFAKKS
jgi:ethanolamine-phosphate cytidylyltransferase